MENQKKGPITVDARAGANISLVGDTYRILISGSETNGAFAAIDMLIPPDGGPGPHAHSAIEESFYVIDGEIEFKSESGVYTASKGSYVNIPKGGVVHGFKNKTDKVAHLLCTVVPAGLETFFEEVGTPVAYGEFLPAPHLHHDAVAKLQEIAEKHGQKLYPPNYLG